MNPMKLAVTNNTSQTKFKFLIFSILLTVLIILLITIPLYYNWLRLQYGHINTNDFSIYQQAIIELTYTKSWNPFLTIRNLKIFNDHFDPILLIAVSFLKIFNLKTPFSLLFFEWGSYLLFLFVGITLTFQSKENIFYKIKTLSGKQKFYYIFSLMGILLFSRSLLEAISYPIHPTTWSMVPILLLFFSITKKSNKGIIFYSTLLLSFKEIFVYGNIGLSLYYLCQKRYKLFLQLLSISLLYLLFLTYLRPLLFGEVENYGKTYLTDMLANPLQFLKERIHLFVSVYKFFLPSLILGILTYYKDKKDRKVFFNLNFIQKNGIKELASHPFIAAIFFSFPIFAIHFIANYLYLHHSVPMVTPFIAVLLFSSFPKRFATEFDKRTIILIMVLFIATSISRYSKMVNLVAVGPERNIFNISLLQDDFKDQTSARKDKINSWFNTHLLDHKIEARAKLLSFIQTLQLEHNQIKVLASGGIIPHLISPGLQIYQFSDNTPLNLNFKYIISEKNIYGDIFPLQVSQLETIVTHCKEQPGSSLIFENDFFLVLEGNFSEDCLKLEKLWPRPQHLSFSNNLRSQEK